ncbi:MAG: kinase/pyrophosphorylase [Rickettsiales bacterium]|nr:kinase/pyrophosphorylase [Rickettsiales bacterium]
MKELHIHLVSDSTAGTVSAIARAVVAEFDEVNGQEHIWALLRSEKQLEKFEQALMASPGPVFYTMVDGELSEKLQRVCARLNLPCINPLERASNILSAYLQQKTSARPGSRHEMNDNYFSRIEAIDYTLSHDDGKRHWELASSDIVLVGPSRTSKSPTCVYLAYGGLKAANVPYVYGVDLPEELFSVEDPLVVGLIIHPRRLIEIRRSRLESIGHETLDNYADDERVEEEIKAARQIYRQNGWPVIDVSQRSVEETAAAILNIYHRRREEAEKEEAS